MEVSQILTAITAVVVTALGVLSTQLPGLIKAYISKKIVALDAQTEAIKNQDARELAQQTLSIANTAFEKAVSRVQQTMVETFKNAAEDGKLSSEEIEKLQSTAKDVAFDILGNEGVEALKSTVGNIDTFVLSTIDEMVLKLKSNQGVVLTSSTVSNTETTSSDITTEDSTISNK